LVGSASMDALPTNRTDGHMVARNMLSNY
jgi:hypothetical protein